MLDTSDLENFKSRCTRQCREYSRHTISKEHNNSDITVQYLYNIVQLLVTSEYRNKQCNMSWLKPRGYPTRVRSDCSMQEATSSIVSAVNKKP